MLDIIHDVNYMRTINVNELMSMCDRICNMDISESDIDDFEIFLDSFVKQESFRMSYVYAVNIFIDALLHVYDNKRGDLKKVKTHHIVIRDEIKNLICKYIFKPDDGWFDDQYSKLYLKNGANRPFFYYVNSNYYRLFNVRFFEDLRKTNPLTFTYAILALSCKYNFGGSNINKFFNKSQKHRESWSVTINDNVQHIPENNKLFYVFMNENALSFLKQHLNIRHHAYSFLSNITAVQFTMNNPSYKRMISTYMPIHLTHDEVTYDFLFSELLSQRSYFFTKSNNMILSGYSRKRSFWSLYKNKMTSNITDSFESYIYAMSMYFYVSDKNGHLNWSILFSEMFAKMGYDFREYTDTLDPFLKIRVLLTELDSLSYQYLDKHNLYESDETNSHPILALTDLFSDIDIDTLDFYLYGYSPENNGKGYSNLGIRNKHIHPSGLIDQSDGKLDIDFGLIVYILLILWYKIHDETTKD